MKYIQKKKKISLICKILLSTVLVCFCLSIKADAVTYVQITSAMQVVDSFNGVDAVYRPNSADGSDPTYSCAAYVHRYYSSVYEVTVSNLLTGRVPAASRGSFSVTSSPEPGDIGYQINSTNNGHWFIIKKVNGDGTYTVIEQNYKNNYANSAPVGRVVGSSTPGFKVYRWSLKGPTHIPYGAIDGIEGGTNSIRIYGWAKDDDEPNKALNLHVYIDGPAGIGKCIKSDIIAGTDSPDVGKHRFDVTFSTDYTGEHTIYVYAINEGAGNHNPLLDGSPKTITITGTNHVPYGVLDKAIGGAGTIRVCGWAKDDDAPDTALNLHVYIDGPAGIGKCIKSDIIAGIDSPDVGKHRFDVTFSTDYTGEHTIYVYTINEGAGNHNPLLNGSPKTITITETNHVPYGALDKAIGGIGTIRVYGWAKDDDTPDTALNLHVYIDGPAGVGKCIKSDIIAENYSPDVGKHRFDVTFSTDYTGDHTIYVYAINAGTGNHNPLLDGSPQTVNIGERNHVPYGALDIAEGKSGKIRVYGWAKDDDEPDTALKIQVYIDGPVGTGKCIKSDIIAGNSSTDVGKHRFDVTFDTECTGTHSIYIYAVNAGVGNQNPLLDGCPKTVTITSADMERPVFEGCSLSSVTGQKCRFTVNAKDNIGVDHVNIRLRNGSESIVYQAVHASGSQWTCDIPYDLTDSRTAVIESEVYDAAGNYAVMPGTTDRVCAYAVIHQERVLFDACGGTGSGENKNVLYSRLENRVKGTSSYYSQYGTLPSATRTGYIFEGWYTASAGGSKITDSELVTTDGNHTLFARWKEKTFTVTYVSEGGAAVPEPQTKLWTKGLILSEEVPVWNGYFFRGWAAGDTLYQPGDMFYLNADTVLTAVWEVIPSSPDLVLPANLTVIEEGAFEKAAIGLVVIPASTDEIGSGAFADCPCLRFVQFMGNTTVIDESAFHNSDIVILAPENSSAIRWAREHDIPFAVQ